MKEFYVGISDKVLNDWIKDKEYITPSDEGEAIAIGAGYFLATRRRANVFMSSDGFCNALNFITSYVIPEKIEMNLIISTGRQEPPHKVMSDLLPTLIKELPYDAKILHFEIMQR
jgi:sulfopyruvate decarboxylase TPP-binding subunit